MKVTIDLDVREWVSIRNILRACENSIILNKFEDQLDQYIKNNQPDRLNPEDIYYRNEDGTYPTLKACINICDSQNCDNK